MPLYFHPQKIVLKKNIYLYLLVGMHRISEWPDSPVIWVLIDRPDTIFYGRISDRIFGYQKYLN